MTALSDNPNRVLRSSDLHGTLFDRLDDKSRGVAKLIIDNDDIEPVAYDGYGAPIYYHVTGSTD